MTRKKKQADDCPDGMCDINGAALGGYDLDGTFADELLEALDDEPEAKKTKILSARELVPKKPLISHRCLEFGKMIGPVTQKQGKKALETGGLFLTDLGDDLFRLYDFIVPRKLEVTIGSIRIDNNYDTAAREVYKWNKRDGTNKRSAALFHIHPSKRGGLHHSKDDDDVLVNLTNKFAKTTRRVHGSRFDLIQSTLAKEYDADKLILKGDALSDAIVKFVYPDDEAFYTVLKHYGLNPKRKDFKKNEFMAQLLDIIDHTTEEPRLVNFAWSFVFNNSGKDDPYVALGVQEKFVLSQKEAYKPYANVGFEMFDEDKNLPTADEVKKIVKERTIFPKWGHTRYVTTYPAKGTTVVSTAAKYAPLPWGGFGVNKITPSVKDRIEFMVEEELSKLDIPETENIVEETINIPDDTELLLEALDTGESVAVGPGKPVKPELPNGLEWKENRDYNEPLEIATMFVMAAFQYRALSQRTECKYSTYIDFLIDDLSEYRPGITNQIGFVANTAPQTYGLKDAVLAAGPLVEDNPLAVEQYDTNFYAARNATISLALDMVLNEDETTLQFMEDFSFAHLEGRNELLENYVNQIYKDAAPAKQKSVRKTPPKK